MYDALLEKAAKALSKTPGVGRCEWAIESQCGNGRPGRSVRMSIATTVRGTREIVEAFGTTRAEAWRTMKQALKDHAATHELGSKVRHGFETAAKTKGAKRR